MNVKYFKKVTEVIKSCENFNQFQSSKKVVQLYYDYLYKNNLYVKNIPLVLIIEGLLEEKIDMLCNFIQTK